MMGDKRGKITLRNLYKAVAPSTSAASTTGRGSAFMPARIIRNMKGVHCQASVIIAVGRALLRAVCQLLASSPRPEPLKV